MITKFLTLRKSKRTLRQMHKLYARKANTLDSYSKQALQEYLTLLQAAILKKDATEAKRISAELEQTSHRLMPKTSFDKARDFITGIAFALIVAVLIRTMWFELYTIPTGSMRPTLKEQDFLVVSKTDYGINVPLQASHFYFDPSLVQRGSIVVFNGENMDIEDVDTMYFYLFPGKKQFVKRLAGKPGDTLYFYGGQMYGIDASGEEIDLTAVNQIEHIPFIRFDGKVEAPNGPVNGVFSPVIFHQMNQPVAKLNSNLSGEMIPQRGRSTPAHYSDLWGMKHFAMARLLTKAQVSQIHPKSDVGPGVLYLELTHHPTLQGASLIRDEYNRSRPELAVSTSLIPLTQKHLDQIAAHMTTCRFIVKNGVAYRYGWNPHGYFSYLPRMPGVPDGTYEIQDGKVYKLPFTWLPIFGGYSYAVASDHPLYKRTPEQLYLLYNLGIELFNQYLPTSKAQRAFPSRYAYFKNQDLYLLGAPILKKDDPTLIEFVQREQASSTPFIDNGPPTLEEIRKNGIHIPDKMYLALGDNHAMSADSRQFGFVPEDNLKGGVSFLFSPPGERLGRAPQPSQPHLTIPNIAVWTGFVIAMIASSFYYRRKLRSPLKF